MSVLTVDVWSDIACPWCWIGKRRLESALYSFGDPLEVRWHAFELNPAAPVTSADDPPIDYTDRLAKKYMRTRAEAQAMIDRMAETGLGEGLDMRFDRVRATNTFDAHRLSGWAGEHGHRDQMVERLFHAYFNEGRLLSDHAVLAELAEDVGLDGQQASAMLASDGLRRAVRQDEDMAAQLGVTGVPFFLIGGLYAVPGAQPADLLLSALREVQTEIAATPEASCTDASC